MSRYFPVLLIAFVIAGFIEPEDEFQGKTPSQLQSQSVKQNTKTKIQTPQDDRFVLEGTSPLRRLVTESIREEQRQQIIQYFTRQIAATPAKRDSLWQPSFSSRDAYRESLQGHRTRLGKMLGLIQFQSGIPQATILQEDEDLKVEDVSIPIDRGLSARALVFSPRSGVAAGGVIAIPPSDQSREEFVGIVQGMTPAKWLSALLERNVTVAVPIMVERRDDHPLCRQAGDKDRRRLLWRAGFIVGRTLVGVEVQQVLALREFLTAQRNVDANKIALMGEGQGGMTALYAGAVDEGFAGVASLDYFQQRENCWKEPVDRVLYGQLNEFGDAEVAALIAPRPLLVVQTSKSPIPSASVKAEFERARRFYKGLQVPEKVTTLEVQGDPLEAAALKLASLLEATQKQKSPNLTIRIPVPQVNEERNRHFEALLQYLRGLCAVSDQVRADYWQFKVTAPEDRLQKVQRLHTELANLVGVIPSDNVPLNPRTALIGETDKFLAYDVFLDVVPGVEAYGQLLVPRAVAGHSRTRLPAVVCQHGFDGAPKYISGVGNNLETNDHFYHRFGQRLAERGYVVFAPYLTVPQYHPPVSANPGANLKSPAGLGDVIQRADLINPIVRLAAPLGMMRTSIELAKLHRVVDFLQSLHFVDPDRIGYYGLSYGGYSAIWMSPLEPRLKLTVISAFFNDWRTMLTDTTRFGSSYWSLPDEDFYNWNVLNRFAHTELIAAMWPRPVCVEYGSEDPVTTPAWHKRAWREVNAFIESWDMDNKIVDDDFIGPHTIHGIGTFFFLDRWLRPESPAGRDYGCCDDNYCYKTVAPGFHGYSQDSKGAVPYVTQYLDSNHGSAIRGQFYVSDATPVFTGMTFKLARRGNAGDVLVRFGSSEASGDLGEARIYSRDVYLRYDLWYEATLNKPVRLDPKKTYFFELWVESGRSPNDCYAVFGPMPLGGKDIPSNFGLSFRTLVRKDE